MEFIRRTVDHEQVSEGVGSKKHGVDFFSGSLLECVLLVDWCMFTKEVFHRCSEPLTLGRLVSPRFHCRREETRSTIQASVFFAIRKTMKETDRSIL